MVVTGLTLTSFTLIGMTILNSLKRRIVVTNSAQLFYYQYQGHISSDVLVILKHSKEHIEEMFICYFMHSNIFGIFNFQPHDSLF